MDIIELSSEEEQIAQLMLEHKGNLNLVSRDPSVYENVMTLRRKVKDNPTIRQRYQELLSEELQDLGLHISERILKFAKMQEVAFGDEETPADPKQAIEISKHISELIRESKNINVGKDSIVMISSKESVGELLQQFIES